jgi:hypothetical protein
LADISPTQNFLIISHTIKKKKVEPEKATLAIQKNSPHLPFQQKAQTSKHQTDKQNQGR